MIQPIQTTYKGFLFRSRLEARWAVFFDKLGIEWEYEKEGFDIDGKYYLPDFYIPHLDLWVEIKPGSKNDWPNHIVFDYLNKKDNEKFNFILLVGRPWVDPKTIETWSQDGNQLYSSFNGFEYNGIIYCDDNYRWCECPQCKLIGITFDGRSYRLPCKCYGHNGYDKGYNSATPRLISAYNAASKSRFEHNGN